MGFLLRGMVSFSFSFLRSFFEGEADGCYLVGVILFRDFFMLTFCVMQNEIPFELFMRNCGCR